MKKLVLNNGTEIEVLETTPLTNVIFLPEVPYQTALDVLSVMTDEALVHVELQDGGAVIDAKDNQTVTYVMLSKTDSGEFLRTVELGQKSNAIDPEILDKARAYDILMGGA